MIGTRNTIAAIAGSIAEPYWGVPAEFVTKAKSYLEPEMVEAVDEMSRSLK